MKQSLCHCFILSLYATTAGFAFAMFEGPLSPFDWGVKRFDRKKRNADTLKAMIGLIERYKPQAIIIEDAIAIDSRRVARIRRLYNGLIVWAEAHGIAVHRYGRSQIRQTFARFGGTTKDDIALIIAKTIPSFEHRRPPLRQPWMSEDARMWLFDAVALAFTYFHLDAVPERQL
ncbi:hypothetical protein [Dongia sp.]|uniref:hypothetical protein n=1 Tax=Dongia sp. TaxID=1977262 RepID=UPI0035B32C45